MVGPEQLARVVERLHVTQAAPRRGIEEGARVGEYPNFVEEPVDASAFFDPAAWRRLREVKTLYDPGDLFRANHAIAALRP